jgi:hypothetical protein
VKLAAYNNAQIDRQIQMSSDSVDQLCRRYFYPIDATRVWDWPNFQYTYPWKVYFDQHGLITLQQLSSGGVIIPNNAVLLYPPNDSPPSTWIELRRDQNFSFGNGSTPQEEIQVQGTWGWWLNQTQVGTLSSGMNSSVTSLPVTYLPGSTPLSPGDTVFVGTERMIVTDSQYTTSGQTQQGSGVGSASAADNQLTVTTGAAFVVGEVLLLDAEWMYVLNIMGNVLTVKRAWGGSVLTSHSGATINADTSLTVVRGALGTTAATQSSNAPVSVLNIPPLVNELALAEALVGVTQEPSAWAFDIESRSRTTSNVYGRSGLGQVREPALGIGLTDLRDRCASQYGRQARSRVV